MTSPADRGVPPDAIEAMAAALEASNPSLYRHLALYLQVLRQVLPARVDQACFHLATQVHHQRYAALPAQERLELHARLLALVQRCTSLLTVEQLTALADQMDREAQHHRRRQQRDLLEQLSSGSGDDAADDDGDAVGDGDGEDSTEDPVAFDRAATDPGAAARLQPHRGGLPAGSIRLDFAPPLSGHWGAFSPPGPGRSDRQPPHEANPLAQGPETVDSAQESAASAPEPAGFAQGEDGTGEAPGDDDEELVIGDLDAHDLEGDSGADLDLNDFDDDLIAPHDSLAAAGSGGGSEAGLPAAESLQQRLAQGPDAAEILKIVREAMEDSRERGRPDSPFSDGVGSSPWREGRLPRDPVTLLRWLDGVDKALLRRLRNLSHALNVELLRVGISRGLLPVSLLDAVLEGQIETMASPSNVLHLQLPFSLRPGAAEVHALAILLRPVDLEMDEPRLRTCRRRLQHQRQELRRMAHQFRRLQRRLQAHEAERLWLQDIRNSRPPQA